MLTFLIPTAKEMQVSHKSYSHSLSDKSRRIVDQICQLTPEELTKIYKTKLEHAKREWLCWQAIQNSSAPAYPALKFFNGLMYRHIKRDQLTQAQKDFLDQHVYITSALYGILPIYQPIAQHRLDFQTKLTIRGKSLKHYWQAEYDKFAAEQGQIISLLSSEFETVFSKSSRHSFIRVKFMEEKDGQLKTHSTISKKARGLFLSSVSEKQIDNIEELKKLQFGQFCFQTDLSSKQELVFVKRLNS